MTLEVKHYGEGEPLVLIHGWGYDSRVWQSLIPELSKQYCVYLVNLPGYGNSSFCNKKNYLQQSLDGLETVVPSSAYYIGWSLGGLIIRYFADCYPRRVKQSGLIACNPYFAGDSTWPGVDAAALSSFQQQLETNDAALWPSFASWQGNIKVQRSLQKTFANTHLNHEALKKSLACLVENDSRHLKGNHSYLLAENDPLVPKEVMPFLNKTMIVEGARHAPLLSHQQQTVEWIKRCCNN